LKFVTIHLLKRRNIPKRICNMLGFRFLRTFLRSVSADILRLFRCVATVFRSVSCLRLSVCRKPLFSLDYATNAANRYSEFCRKPSTSQTLGVTCLDLFSLFVRKDTAVIHFTCHINLPFPLCIHQSILFSRLNIF
jgi:hypothetical protein